MWRTPCVPVISSVAKVNRNYCSENASNTLAKEEINFSVSPWKKERGGRLSHELVGFQDLLFFPGWVHLVFVSVVTPPLSASVERPLQSWRLPLNRRWSPSDLHLALDTAAFHKMTLRELSAFMYPTLNLKLGFDFTSNCTEMQWLQWVVCNFFCWSICWQNRDKNKQLVLVKSQGQPQTAYFVHKWFNVTGHGESRRSVRKNKQERKYYFRIAHPK